MNTWDFPNELKPGESYKVYVDFDTDPFIKITDDKGLAVYSNDSMNFKVQARCALHSCFLDFTITHQKEGLSLSPQGSQVFLLDETIELYILNTRSKS